ncbi:Methyl-CpG-binding domain protein 4-like protein [Eumeta japonica]|uniref:Methyl-CpG-binding domain protein 4-like protein n=1 Tax=Eumeta variegata TaxID=151549 RepID=A0A4C1XRS4_EUMVA|nr:Methyl-CpG-binding domain protein 4-like protein [Eumeta japonica]
MSKTKPILKQGLSAGGSNNVTTPVDNCVGSTKHGSSLITCVVMDECRSQFFHDEQNSTQLNESQNLTIDSANLSQNSTDSDPLSLSQLTLDEQEQINIQPFYNITPRPMPVSPHYVFEEEFSSNPWAMLVATIFLTKTSGKTARPSMKKFFDEYPTPYSVLETNPQALERFFENLGLKKRGAMIWKMSYQFMAAKWRRASDLYGIGKYGEEAFRIFHLGHTDLEPGDRYLKLYVDWLRNHTDHEEDNSVADCECGVVDPALKYYCISL